MARPTKETVDYFPHFTKSGRTLFILESRFGNDGYAFWFKLLEILGGSEGHFYDCKNPNNWAYLLAKTRTTEEQARNILETLLELGKIDKELWKRRQIIWCEHFVQNISSVYKMRRMETPRKPAVEPEEPEQENVSLQGNPDPLKLQASETDKEKESKEKERKVNTYGEIPTGEIADLWNSVCSAFPKVIKLNDNRRKKIKLRCGEWGCKTKEECLAKAQELFERVSESNFLRGENKSGWQATFDWVFENPSNWVKVLEGNYANERGARGGSQNGVQLGVGEYIDGTGRRTYGTGKATIPKDAPPRPSERYSWDGKQEAWVLL